MTDAPIAKVTITYEGAVAALKIKALTPAALAGLLRPSLADVNMVSAPVVAKERGIVIEEVTRAAQGDYESFITLSVTTAKQERAVGGTVFHDGKPRILSIKDIKVDAEFAPSMIYVTNEDKPGFIGRFAGLLGEAGINIATFALGRDQRRRLGDRAGRDRRPGAGGRACQGRRHPGREAGEGAEVLSRLSFRRHCKAPRRGGLSRMTRMNLLAAPWLASCLLLRSP